MGNQGQWRSFRVEHREGSPGVWVGFSFVTLGEVLNFLGLSFPGKPRWGARPVAWPPAPGRDLSAPSPLRAHTGA